jgi:drug/metabolite transporter (DMT)-like permease
MGVSVAILLFVTLVWGTTFPLLKAASATLSGVEISAIRFCIAGLFMLPFAWAAPRQTWKDGALLGAAALVSYVAQAFGLEYISSNRSAFLTSLNVLMTPLLGLAFGASLSWVVLGAAALACVGIGLMSWEGGANLVGDGATVLCALAYALYVIWLSQRANRNDARQLAATQIVLMAVFGGLWVLGNGLVHPQALATLATRAGPQLPQLLYLGLIATAGMLFLQALAQRKVPADKAAVIYAMEPVFAALFGWLWLNEVLSPRAAFGGALVVAAVIVSELKPGLGKKAAA